MRVIRGLGNVVLWLVAIAGGLSILVWGATQLGYIKPLVVISGSMEPQIMTGDLVIATKHASSDVRPGDVASLHSVETDRIITHRVVDIQPAGNGTWAVHLKGDANDAQDGETYVVGESLWGPVLTVPNGGYVVTKLMQRQVVVPLGITLLALLGIALYPSDPPRPSGRHTEEASDPTESELVV